MVCLLAAHFNGIAGDLVRSMRSRASFLVAGSAPDTLVVLGPKQFVTTKANSSVNFVESFSVPPLSTGSDWKLNPNAYSIRLTRVPGSGDPASTHLTVATVLVNGNQVATAADFVSAVSIERPVSVNSVDFNNNSVSLTLKGDQGAGLIVTIVGTPNSAFNVFGPKVYTKTATTPTHFVESFALPAEASVPYNISATPSVAGTKATITVNGAQVIKDTDFGTTVAPVSRAVNLVSGNNSMVVDVRGTTGTTITVVVTATDKTSPVLTITSPQPNLVTNATSISVMGTSQDRVATQVKVNGVVATMSGVGNTQFSASAPLTEGSNGITIRATDLSGNHTDSTRTVTRDTQAPTLTVTSPADNSYSNQDAVTVSGTVSDATTATVKVNGVSFPVGQGGAFTGSYQLVAGANFITITATDAGGNVTSQVRKVTQDRTAPALTLTAPADGSYSNAIAVSVTGTAADAGTLSVKVNGFPATVNPDGSFSYSFTLAPGVNAISVTATDGAANTTTLSRTVTQDRSAPAMSVTIPVLDSTAPFATSDTAIVTITAIDASPVTVTLTAEHPDGSNSIIPLTVDANGRLIGVVTFSEGNNGVGIDIIDAAGNVGPGYGRLAIRDTKPPVISLTSPADGLRVDTPSVLVAGVIEDSQIAKNYITASVNGIAICPDTLGPEGTYPYPDPTSTKCRLSTQVPLVPGSNTISIVAHDGAGNTATLTRIVTLGAAEVIPPDPATVAPPLDATVSTTTFAATSFLYTGANPIQTGVAAGTIQPLRSAVVRGSVRNRDGSALPGAQITVLDHPEFGQTLSRADGAFDLVVNGGEPLTVNYQKAGFLPAQRAVSPIWQDYTSIDSVTLVSLDAAVTTVDFSQPTQVAQGTPVTDASGTRQATVIFKSGTHATLKLPDGTSQALNSIAVRATEYTVGPSGPSAMPAELPPTTAYTYAVELSVDAAIAAGAKSVVFDQPVAFYVDNFLNFPIGKPVPVGYYDRESAQWIASPNGRIIKLLQVVGGRASIDVDGSGTEATPEALAALGVNEAELARLGTLYATGKSLWRASITHFSTLDLNYGRNVDTTSKPPTRPNPVNKKGPDKDCQTRGSIIGCERQTLGESLSIAGTSLSLNYQSDRVPGYKEAYSADISIIGDTVPLNLSRIELEVRIGGRVTRQTYSNQPNQIAHFVWDGKDPYGRSVQGTQVAEVRIGYVYPARFADVVFWSLLGDFGNYASDAITQDPARSEATLWQVMPLPLGTHNRSADGLGGWGIDVHHYYDPMGQVLYLGNGTRRTGSALSNATTTIAGTDCTSNCANRAKPGDRAVDAFMGVEGMGLASDGTMYLGDDYANKIWHVNTAGILELVVGNGTRDGSGDGGAATSAGIYPSGLLKVGPDNSIYFSDYSVGQRIRRIDKNGIITTVAGTGVCGSSIADGTLATQANLCFPDFTLAKDGTLFLESQTEVYRVRADGILTRVVGDGTFARCPNTVVSFTCAEGKPANAPGVFHQLRGIAVGADGTLYLANREFRVSNGMVIYRIGTDGIIRRVAGNGNASGPLVNGGPATSSSIIGVRSELGIGADGSLYYTEEAGWVYRVDERGLLRILAGCVSSPGPATCVRNSGGRATLTTLNTPRALDFGPDGRLYILDRIARRVDPPVPALGLNVTTVASEDGSQLYVFGADGKHLRTLDALLGSTIFEFAYDQAGLLSSISDGQGNTTTLERDAAGLPVTMVAPFGQRTALTTDEQHYLSSIQRPGQPATVLVHGADGLLRSLTDPNGTQHQFTYDANGLLIRDDNGSGGFTTLARTRTDSSSSVTLTTAMSTTAVYSATSRSIGGSRRVNVDGVGLATTGDEAANGTVATTDPDGTVRTVAQGFDPRFGAQVPVMNRVTTRTPSGLLATVTGGRRTVLSNQADPTSLVSQVDSMVLNGRLFRNTYVAATRTSTAVTPEGRSRSELLDTLGRAIEEAAPGITALQYQYDARGRLAQGTQGSRRWSYTYDSQGRLATTTDPLTRTSESFYDSADRLTRQVLTDGRELLYAYDLNGNPRSITPPGRQAHQFEYSGLNLLTSYNPPSLGTGTWSTTFQYDLDRRLTQIARPDGQNTGFGYDSAGRLSTVSVLGGALNYTYDSITGSLTDVSGPYGGSLSLGHDGSLLTRVTWSGEVTGAVTATFNSDFKVAGLSVNGGTPVTFSYDGDGLLSRAGELTISRSATNGLITGTALGSVATNLSYSPFGELARQSASVSGSTVFDISYSRDALGRISELTETVGGATTAKGYIYDLAGRVTEVRENGALTAVYEYDANGNRLRVTRLAGVEIGTYDEQDRLLTFGTASYTYTRNGELTTKTVGSDITRYEYDAFGNLRRVTQPDGTLIEYVVDGMNRRIGKKMNGVLVQGFLYQGKLSPIVELDGAGNVVSRFVYGTRANVPEYVVRNGTTYRIITDHLGSVRLVIETATGAIAQLINYDVWGNVLQDSNPGFQPFGYAGGLFDNATKLMRFGARDYDPGVGRWTAKDPIGFGGGSLGLYTYVHNDPVAFADPRGLCPTEENESKAAKALAYAAACGGEWAQVLLSAASDVAFLTGVGAAAKLGIAAARQGAMAAIFSSAGRRALSAGAFDRFSSASLRALQNTALKRGNSLLAALTLSTAIGKRYGIDEMQPDNVAQLASDYPNWHSLVPLWGTWDDYAAARECEP